MTELVSMFVSVMVFLWVWITFIYYFLSYRKFISTELKKVLRWVTVALYIFVLNVTFLFFDRTFWGLPTETTVLVSNTIVFFGALCFLISAVYMHRFSKVFGFADEGPAEEKQKKPGKKKESGKKSE